MPPEHLESVPRPLSLQASEHLNPKAASAGAAKRKQFKFRYFSSWACNLLFFELRFGFLANNRIYIYIYMFKCCSNMAKIQTNKQMNTVINLNLGL